MSFLLFASSGTHVQLFPEYGMSIDEEIITTRHRSQSGKQYVYKWGRLDGFKLPVQFLTNSEAQLINQFWRNNTNVTLVDEDTSDEYSMRIMGDKRPIAQLIKPYDDLWKGTIELESY